MQKYHEEEHLDHVADRVVQGNLTSQFLQRMEELDDKNRQEEQRYQWALEEYRQAISDQYRREDQNRQSEHDLNEFFDKTDLQNSPKTTLQRKILSLTRYLNPFHKALLIKTLYQEKLLSNQCDGTGTSPCKLDLTGADFSGIQLGNGDKGNFEI